MRSGADQTPLASEDVSTENSHIWSIMNPRLSINYFQCGKKTLDFTNIYNYITACDIFKKLTAEVRFHCGLLFAHFFLQK